MNNTVEQAAIDYANKEVPNAHKHDAPYYTTLDKHEDLQNAFIAGAQHQSSIGSVVQEVKWDDTLKKYSEEHSFELGEVRYVIIPLFDWLKSRYPNR